MLDQEQVAAANRRRPPLDDLLLQFPLDPERLVIGHPTQVTNDK
jgi:hypothetical protein